MSAPDPIRAALREIEQHTNELARLCIQAGFPLATSGYAKVIAKRLMEIDMITHPIIAPKKSETIILEGEPMTPEQIAALVDKVNEAAP
jgi:hypothetical protein